MRVITDDYLCLQLTDELDELERPLSLGLGIGGRTLKLCVDDILETLNNSEQINEYINDYIEELEDFKDFTSDEEEFKIYNNEIEYIKQFLDNPMDLLNKADYITLLYDLEEQKKLINSELLKNKKILMEGFYTIKDFKEIKKLYETFIDNKDRIYIYLEGNEAFVTIEDAYNATKIIAQEAEFVKKLNLSPIEKVMVAYDIVRDRKYIRNDKDYNTSRDLCSILKQQAIVCSGYTNHLIAILDYLNIECHELSLVSKNSGHSRCIMYIDDSKYSIDGVYCFDPTWDSKQEGNNYLNRYKYFARTIEEFEEFEGNKYASIYSDYKKLLKEGLEQLVNKNYSSLVKNVTNLNRISQIAKENALINKVQLLPFYPGKDKIDIPSIKEKINRIIKKYDNPIPAETFIKIVNNVRKKEYYIDPSKYEYNINVIYRILRNSCWTFKYDNRPNELKMLENLFGKVPEEKYEMDNYINFCRNNKIFDIIAGVKLTKTLQVLAQEKQKRL